MLTFAEQAAERTVIRELSGIQRAFVMTNDAETDTTINLGTEGLNFLGMTDPTITHDLVEINHIETNDIYAVLKRYGVEAARAAIKREVAGVFAVYGINVDDRHLGLIADYMVQRRYFKWVSSFPTELIHPSLFFHH